MSYRIASNGTNTIECDTAQEAMELHVLLAAKDSRRSAKPDATKGPDFPGFWGELNKIGKKIIDVLWTESNPISSATLAEKCGITTKELPSKMIHVRRTAKRFNIPEPVVRKTEIVKRRPTGMYHISEKLKEGLADVRIEKGAK